MLGLRTRQNGYRIILPKNFLLPEIEEKYSNILRQKKGFFNSAIDYLNESIQRVELFGFSEAAEQQMQTGTGWPQLDYTRIEENNFQYPGSEYNYRSSISPMMLIDKTFNIEFRHQAGFLNYFMVFENFWYTFSRDFKELDLCREIPVEIYDEHGVIYCKVTIKDPVLNGMDMLAFDYTQPIPTAMTFKVEFKYSNFNIDFIDPALQSDTYTIDDMNIEGNNNDNINILNCR